MEELIYKGFVIGILVSAPMGPIGVLVIQRTLSKGRLHGFFSGVGALLSDLIYAFITASGLGIVMNTITAHETAIKLLGSVVLAAFGFYLTRSNPSGSLGVENSQQQPNTYKKDTLTAFLITLSNPLIIFLYIGLFARFNFFQEGATIVDHIFGLFAIGGGAICWWLFISWIFNKLRNKFNIRKLYIINKIIGWIIISFGVVGMVLGSFEAYEQYIH